MILRIRRVLGGPLFRAVYEAVRTLAFLACAVGFLAAMLLLAMWILEVSKRP